MSAAPLPSLREHLQQHHIAADKKLGQHFLLDQNVTDKVVRFAGDLQHTHVIEIGPGPGGLTRAILKANPASLTLVEKDSRFISLLQEVAASSPKNVTVLEGDALQVSLPRLTPEPRAVMANLPYNVGTSLLIGWLHNIATNAESYTQLILMLQKEVVDRLVATPHSKAYGRLSILTQWLCEVESLFHLPPSAFSPPPKVDSTVVRLVPRAKPEPCDMQTLEKLTAAAFGQRRKMLRRSLASFHPDTENWLKSKDIDPTARAENLTLADFIRLCH